MMTVFWVYPAAYAGSHLLDDYIAAHFQEVARFGDYRISLRRPRESGKQQSAYSPPATGAHPIARSFSFNSASPGRDAGNRTISPDKTQYGL